MNRRLFLTVLLGLAAPFRAVATTRTRRILRLKTGKVEEVPLEEYVAAVLPPEIGRAPAAALEAQAVAARSYALARTERHIEDGADLCDGTHCQVFRGLAASTEDSRRAAAATRGLVLTQKGSVIAAPFHAVCGGRTARPRDVWDDEEIPDLASVEDDACIGVPGSKWSFVIPRSALPSLSGSFGLPDAHFLEVFGHDASGRVSMVRFAAPGGQSRVARGFEFRKAASEIWGWASVRSTDFTLEETRPAYLLSGRGTGHGAGMCQAGAIVRARRGESRDAILGLYYRGAEARRFQG
ncbi:MAG: SpoIID/LytB domain-containing protein [Acidobacteriota bacterium]|nr:SpoIID/LytB domain-containing protein [Acidobacteriota bacterium]